jgi:hypothetical protein
MNTAALELRRHERHNVLCAVTLAPEGQAHEGYILDLSPGGARVDLTSGWTPMHGATLRLLFEDPAADDPDCEAIALDTQVAWVATDHVGLQFSPAQDAVIARLLAAAGALH